MHWPPEYTIKNGVHGTKLNVGPRAGEQRIETRYRFIDITIIFEALSNLAATREHKFRYCARLVVGVNSTSAGARSASCHVNALQYLFERRFSPATQKQSRRDSTSTLILYT